MRLSIIGTSDVHGQVQRFPVFMGMVHNINHPRLLLDSGDLFRGTLLDETTKGAAMIDLYNRMGYTAAAIGNHEFDYGVNNLRTRLGEAKFPVLNCNIYQDGARIAMTWKGVKPFCIREVGGVRVGIIGATTQETPMLTLGEGMQGMHFSKIEDEVIPIAKALRTYADLIVLIVHKGVPHNGPTKKLIKLAKYVSEYVDVVLGAHTHGGFFGFVDGVAVSQAYSLGQYFSRIDLEFEAHDGRWRLDRQRTEIFPPQEIMMGFYEGKEVVPDQAIFNAVNMWKIHMTEEAGDWSTEVVTSAPVRLLNHPDTICELDFVVAQLLYEGSLLLTSRSLQVVPEIAGAIINKGCVRNSLASGDVTGEAIFNLMPFDDEIVLMSLTAGDLFLLVSRDHGILIPAGFYWDGDGVFIEGTNSDQKLGAGDSNLITLAMSNYVYERCGLSSYAKSVIKTGLTARSTVMEAAKNRSELPRILRRMTA